MTLRMPAEWEKQDATWLAWPHNKEDWPDKFEPIPWVYADIVRHIARDQRVRLLVKNEKQQEQAHAMLDRSGANLSHVDFIIKPTDRVWLRDSGPTVVYDGKARALLDWRFNAWAKYDNWKRDNTVPEAVEQFLGLTRIQPTAMVKGVETHVVLEGGAIDVNGKGTLLTTEECLLSKVQCRNPGMTREGYEDVFANYLGINQVIWLESGIVGDDTHGHVDDITRFVAPDTILTAVEKDKSDPNHTLLAENLKRLKKARDAKGKQFTIAELPMPKPVVFEDQRLPASYANFLICNKVVLVPVFNDPADRDALNIIAGLFPKRDVIGIHSYDFVWGLGTIHCASQQEPAA